jgi:2'-5' RNA ligase
VGAFFLALDAPAEWKTALDARLEPERGPRELRWAPVEGWHVTLVFLGPCAPERVQEVCRQSAACAAAARPFELAGSSAGCFGPEASPLVLWAGLTGALAAARALQASLSVALAVPDEHGAWVPHLTLARARSRAGAPVLRGLAERLGALSLPSCTFDAFTLFESAGGRYVERARFALGGQAVP